MLVIELVLDVAQDQRRFAGAALSQQDDLVVQLSRVVDVVPRHFLSAMRLFCSDIKQGMAHRQTA